MRLLTNNLKRIEQQLDQLYAIRKYLLKQLLTEQLRTFDYEYLKTKD
jgi:hypothetical protein